MFKRRFWVVQEEAGDDKSAGGGAGADAGGAGGDAGTAGGQGDGAGGTVDPNGAGDKGAAGAAAGAGGGDAGAGTGGDAGRPAAGVSDDPWLGLREKIAAGDDKLAQRLGRYATPKAAIDSLIQLQNKISAGELRSVLPKNASAEQITEWRKENGIPEAPEKYELKLATGVQLDAEDQPLIDGLLKRLHGANASSAVASEVVNHYYEEARRQAEDRVVQDKAFASEAQEALRAEWGGEFKLNMNMNDALLDMLPAAVRPLVDGARLSDGNPVLAHPDVMKWLNHLSRQINPVTTLIPNAGANIGGAIDDEIAQIQKMMSAPKGTPDYAKYWESDKTQARYRELLDAQARLGKKAA